MDGGTEVYGTLVSDIQTDVSVTGKPVYLTASGNDITVDVKKGNMTNPVVTMKPIQNLNGYDNPWVGGAERNILDPLQLSEGYLTNNDTVHEQTNAKEYYSSDFIDIGTANNITVGYFGYSEGEEPWIAICWYNSEKEFIRRNVNGSNVNTWNIPENAKYFRVTMSTFNHGIKYSYCSRNSDRTFIPYSNICPITARTKTEISVNGSVITREYGQEIYGGTDEIADGVLTNEYEKTKIVSATNMIELTYVNRFKLNLLNSSLVFKDSENNISNCVKGVQTSQRGQAYTFYVSNSNYTVYIDLPKTFDSDTKATEFVTSNEMEICCELKQSNEILTTKGYVLLDKGTNEITVSNNDIITFDYCSILAGKISGTLSYIEDGLAPSGYLSGSGNFLALHLDSEDWDIYTSVKVGLYPSEGSGMVEILSDEDKICVGKITSNDQVFMVESTDGTLTKTDVYSLSDLVLETE